MSRLALGLVAGLASLHVAAPLAAEEPMTGAERQALRDEVRAYLLEHPEVLIEAMDILQQREESAGLERDSTIIAANSARIFATFAGAA